MFQIHPIPSCRFSATEAPQLRMSRPLTDSRGLSQVWALGTWNRLRWQKYAKIGWKSWLICKKLDEHHGEIYWNIMNESMNIYVNINESQWLSLWFHEDFLINGGLWPRFLESPRGLKKVGIVHLASSAMYLNWDFMVCKIIKSSKSFNSRTAVGDDFNHPHQSTSFCHVCLPSFWQVSSSHLSPISHISRPLPRFPRFPCRSSGSEKLQLHAHLFRCATPLGLCQSARLFAPRGSDVAGRWVIGAIYRYLMSNSWELGDWLW